MRKNLILSLFISFILGGVTMFAFLYFFNLYEDKNQNENIKYMEVDSNISNGVDKVYNSVVVVENYNNTSTSIGSGFIYDEEGYILTNQHVINSSDQIKIKLSNGNVVNATVIGSDEFSDIGVVKIDKKYVSQVATIGSSENIKVGDTVFAIGTPMNGKYEGTVTRGVISGKNRLVEVSVSSSSYDWIMNVMQTDAAINPGNSGGPLCDINGNVIGINSMKIVQDDIEGIGFAIPIEDAIKYANKIVNNEDFNRTYLGITMADATTSKYYLRKYDIVLDNSIDHGVVAIEVDKESPCEKSGILKGDVIVKINEYSVNSVAELRYYLFKYVPGDKVKIGVIRGKENMSFDVELGKSDD